LKASVSLSNSDQLEETANVIRNDENQVAASVKTGQTIFHREPLKRIFMSHSNRVMLHSLKKYLSISLKFKSIASFLE
jgi:hypothetical protein